jgi:glycosyltransferase involved in cell wall biosynthesis
MADVGRAFVLQVAWFGHQSRERGNGLVTYSRVITSGLRERGAEVTFFYHGSDEDGLADERNIRIGSFNILNRATISTPGASRLIEDTLRRQHIQVAHASLVFSLLDFNFPNLCHGLNVPIVATLHFPFDRRFSLWGTGTRALYMVVSLLLPRYDAVIIFSEEQKQLLISCGVPDHIIRVIPNGVDINKWCPGESNYKEEIGAEILVAYCGRVDPEKNVGTLCQVFADLAMPPTCKLVIIGDGVDRERLAHRYADDPRFLFTGLVREEVERIRMVRAADVFVLPSEIEGLSLAMLEAMACGVATVATDVGSDGEALQSAGILIDPRELSAQLKLALKTLLDYPDFCHDLGHRARQRVINNYSLDKNIDLVLTLYEELLSR